MPAPADVGAPACVATGPFRGAGRLPWADLLRRVFAEEVLRCPCGGRRSAVAVVTDAAVVRTLLAVLGLPHEPVAFAPARDPLQVEPEFVESP